MPSYDLPEGFKNHEKYLIGDAARYWAAARYAVPLGIDLREERTRYARELKLAEMELREKVPVQSEKYWDTVRKTRQVPCGDSWNGYTRVAYTATEGKIREYFRGPDLAEYAKEKGCPGLFGFEEPQSKRTDKENNPSRVSGREEPNVLRILGAVLRVYYGNDILEDLTGQRSQRFKEVYDDIRGKIAIDEDTLRKYLKRIPWDD